MRSSLPMPARTKSTFAPTRSQRLAMSFMKQRKLRAALRSYRRAYRINPCLDGISETIDALEKTLGEEGKR